MGNNMTSKERMYAAIEGRKPDIYPVAVPYAHLSNADHWQELTGLPVWKYYEWHITQDMGWYRDILSSMYSQQQFDMVQAMYHYPRGDIEIAHRDGAHFYYQYRKSAYAEYSGEAHSKIY